MPFGALERPAVGLSLLAARLARDGLASDVRYLSFTFADLLGVEEYQWISSTLPYIAFAGDWCFAEDLYGSRPFADAEYIARVLQGTWRFNAEDIARVKAVRTMAAGFLDHCMAAIPWQEYGVVGFTSTFEQNLASLALAKRVKATYPHIATVFGGANWEGEMGEELHRQFSFVDYVCPGEADESFPALAAQLAAGSVKPATLPPGVVYRSGLRTHSTGRSAPVKDLDALPVPDYSDYFREWSESGASLATAPMLLVETSRGCWWGNKSHCAFCGLNGSSLAYRSKSGTRALEEMRFLADRWQTDRIEVVDNILNMRHFADLLPALAADGRPWEIFYEVKANLSREQIASLRAAGVARIQPGIESLSDHVLRLLRKGISALRNVQLLKWCRELGVGVDWNILYGVPGETRDDYDQMLAMLPAIEFLEPPVACGPIRMDRFSPYFENPDAFGLINVRPMEPYAFLYPFAHESLMRIAYHFDFDYRPDRSVAGCADEVIRFAEAWRRKEDRGLLSLLHRPDGSVRLRDTRPDATMREVALAGNEAAAYEFCDECRTFDAIVRYLRGRSSGETITEEGVRGFLESLAANRLMLTDGRNWLSLAVRVQAAACVDSMACTSPSARAITKAGVST